MKLISDNLNCTRFKDICLDIAYQFQVQLE